MNFKKRNIQKRIYTAKRHLVARLKDPKSHQKIGLGMMVFGLFTLAASQAGAFTAPAAGSFAYTVYDVAVTQILGGAIGFVAGVGAMVFGAVLAIQQKVMGAVPSILGGAVLLNAETLVTTLGMTF
ncbi:MAG: hypothetical protein R2860_07760 [Desulfobacterales bacterium]